MKLFGIKDWRLYPVVLDHRKIHLPGWLSRCIIVLDGLIRAFWNLWNLLFLFGNGRSINFSTLFMLWWSLQKLSLHFNTLHTRLALNFQATLRFLSTSSSSFSFSAAKEVMLRAVRAAFLFYVIEFLVPLVESLLYLHLCLHQIIVLFCILVEIILVLLILFDKGLVLLVQVFDQLFFALKLLTDLGYNAINHLRVGGASAVVFEQKKDKLDVLTRLDGWNCVRTL